MELSFVAGRDSWIDITKLQNILTAPCSILMETPEGRDIQFTFPLGVGQSLTSSCYLNPMTCVAGSLLLDPQLLFVLCSAPRTGFSI